MARRAARVAVAISFVLIIFIFIAIILINVGGVSAEMTTNFPFLANPEFDLLAFTLTTTSTAGYFIGVRDYLYRIYLNRLCITQPTTTTQSASSNPRCQNSGLLGTLNFYTSNTNPINGGEGIYALNSIDQVNFAPAFAFFLIAVILVVVLGVLSVAAVVKSGRVVRFVGLAISVALLTSLIIAASVITAQMVHLRNQINAFGYAGLYHPHDAQLGATVFGLIWASVFASLLAVGLWAVVFLAGGEQVEVVSEKREEPTLLRGSVA